jgi:hypothetical protein
MTLLQVIEKLREIARDHRLINSFYFGDISKWSEFSTVNYASCVLTLNNANYSAPLTQLNFSLWIADRLLHDGSNRDNVLSDTLQIMQDLIAMIDNPSFRDWKPELNGALEFFEDDRGNDNADIVAGVKLDFVITVPKANNRCAVPTNTRNAILTEEGLEIFTEDGNYIAPE